MAISIEKSGTRVYLIGDTFAAKDQIKALGGHWDGERRAWWIGAAKADQAQALVDRLNGQATAPDQPKPKQDPSDIRLTGKGEYKGKTYYLGSQTRDGLRVRCLTLPNDKGEYLDFWASLSEVKIVKTYQPRERTWRGRTTTEYTTLGSIADFIARQKDPRTARGECTECGHWGPRGEACSECGGEGTHV